MFVCKKCGWLYSGSHCPRCGMSVNSGDLSEVTLSGYGVAGDSGSMEERESVADEVQSLIESVARELLWDAMHASSPDPDKCLGLAEDLRIYAPEDYYANFVDTVFSGDENMTARFLAQPRAKGAEMYAEPVLDYMCAHMSTELYPVVKRYLEKSDIAQPEKYELLVESYLSDHMKKERDEAEEKKKKEDADRIDAAVREAAERIVKEVAEREIREINERKERESREAEERERKEKEERRKAEDEKKRREQLKTAEMAEKERREAEATKRKREEESVLSPDGYSKGFEYEKKDGGYTLTWIGDCEDKDILIPPVYNGSSVTGIGDKAFVGCKDIKSVTVPSGVTFVGHEAFVGCTGLKSVKLPDTMEAIGESAFKGCTALETVDMSMVTTIGKSAFSGCRYLSKLPLPEGLKSIPDEAFSNCSVRLNDGVMVIPSGVTAIGEDAFNGSYLRKIYIPVSVRRIGENAFDYGTRLYYLGTESQWNEIAKDKYMSGTVYFYSASRPRELGRFWHYDEKGNAVEW